MLKHSLLLNLSKIFFVLLCLCFCCRSFPQCTVQSGPPPKASDFNTDGSGGVNDSHWQIATDSINGTYKPATNMSGLPASYHNNSRWISFSATGEHSGN